MNSNENQLNLQVVGYKSQLHDRGKGKTKSDDLEKRTNPRLKEKQQVPHLKIKQNKEHANYGKGGKPSRVAAKFNGKLPDSSKGHTERNKPRQTVQKFGNTGSASASEIPAAFVTKKDLKKLLETLNENDADNASAVQNETHLGSQGENNKISQKMSTKQDEKTEEINTNKNFQESEKTPSENLDKIARVMKDNNPEHNVVCTTTIKETIKPIAMRSSFAVGAPGVVTNNPHDDKAAKHRQWVKELEQQIREKKEREVQIKRDEYVDVTHWLIETKQENSPYKQTNLNNLLKTTAVMTHSLQETDRSSAGHARGRGLMSMLSESEADKQRKKIFEHQKAIELQVEDRRREKMKERERRLREEAIEDERVAKEREKLQKQFEDEMAKMKEKEEQAKRRTQVMQEGISKAFESAQQLKRDKRKNRLQGSTTEISMKFSHEDKTHNGQQTIVPDENSKHRTKDNRHGVPSLNLRTSVSPVNNTNANFSSRLSDPTINVKPDFASNVKRNSLISVRDVKTSYSEADKDSSETLINKWVDEDFGSSNTDREQNYDRRSSATHSCEVLVPFYRTASATLFRESLASQEVCESKDINELPYAPGNLTDHKVVKKGRSVPEAQPTKTSRLREKKTDSKNLSLTSRRKKLGDARPQQTVEKSKLHFSSQEISDDQVKDKYDTKSSSGHGNETTNIPSHLLATFTPTAHQEKILEQLAALRKGLLMKDHEIKTRLFQINDYEVQA